MTCLPTRYNYYITKTDESQIKRKDYLKPKLERNPKKPVIIRPDIAAPYRYMVQVYDELRQGEDHGLAEPINISVPTQREIQSFWY